jgi:hypothetical protein
MFDLKATAPHLDSTNLGKSPGAMRSARESGGGRIVDLPKSIFFIRDAPSVGNCRPEAEAMMRNCASENPYFLSWLWVPGSLVSLALRNDDS